MTDDELFQHLEQDFNIDISGHVQALNELYRQPHLVQKYTLLFRKEARRLYRLEAKKERIENILKKQAENNSRNRIYEDDLIGLDDVDFGFDPLEPLDHVPMTVASKEQFVKSNKAFIKINIQIKEQKDLVDILKNMASYHVGKNRIDACRIVIDAAKNNMV